jgi:hypothetical protein
MRRLILSALFFLVLLLIWHGLVAAKIWSVVLLPDPISVGDYLRGAAADGTLLQASLVTMRRLLTGDRGKPEATAVLVQDRPELASPPDSALLEGSSAKVTQSPITGPSDSALHAASGLPRSPVASPAIKGTKFQS